MPGEERATLPSEEWEEADEGDERARLGARPVRNVGSGRWRTPGDTGADGTTACDRRR
ncbi:hypothetical protein GCM10022284_61560 [Streptomyces hundungensis]